jgi:hypothetical protein
MAIGERRGSEACHPERSEGPRFLLVAEPGNRIATSRLLSDLRSKAERLRPTPLS